jgi:hypothetical protein
MPSFMKVLLVVAVSMVVIGTLGVVGGYLWWHYNGTSLVAQSKATIKAGADFGSQSNNWGCLEEAISRRSRDNGIKGAAGLFLNGCLNSSAPASDFCDSVPAKSDMVKSIMWRLEMRNKYHIDNKSGDLFATVQYFCEQCRKRADSLKASQSLQPAHQ